MTDRVKKILVAVIVLVGSMGLDLGTDQMVQAEAQTTQRKVIMVVADKLSLTDWTQLSNSAFGRLSRKGAVGLMNTTTGGGRDSANGYATIGAGARVVATRGGGLAFNTWEQVENIDARYLYQSRLGYQPKPEQIVHPYLPQIIEQNNALQYSSNLGALGTQLHKAGLKTYLWGNSDYEDIRQRFGALIAMDEQGVVDGGLVDAKILQAEPTSLYGVTTNWSTLVADIETKWDKFDFAVIDLGDTLRVDSGANVALPEVAAAHRSKALEEADQFLERIAGRMDARRDLLIVVTPSPGTVALENKFWYGPVLFYGAGVEAGMLTSGTTKREGIIANIDLAPTILRFFGIERPGNMYGDSVTFLQTQLPLEQLLNIEAKGHTILSGRSPLVQGFIIIVILCIFFGLSSVFLQKPKSRYIRPLLLWLMSIPAAFLLVGLAYPNSIWGLAVEIVLVSAMITGGAVLFGKRNSLRIFVFINALTMLVILADILLGSPMMKASVLGYDAMVGARFYGIGNEFMGVLIGSTIIGSSILLELTSKRIMVAIIPLYIAVTYVMAAPNLGTNVGGTIAAVVGFTVTGLLMSRVKINWRVALSIAAGVLVVLLLFIAFDLTRAAESQSHIGRTARLILNNGIGEVYNIITRKLAVNLRLILGITVWARVFIGSLVAIGILSVRPVGVMKEIKSKYPHFYTGLIGAFVASCTALVFNDSGIVAAALLMIYPVYSLIYLVLLENYGANKMPGEVL